MSGHFTPGMHLTIDALTSRYGVSHMPIREALRQLEGEGILISIVHRGFRIEAITEDYIRNIYDIRVGIESMLAHRAVERATDEDIAMLRRTHEGLSDLIRSGNRRRLPRRTSSSTTGSIGSRGIRKQSLFSRDGPGSCAPLPTVSASTRQTSTRSSSPSTNRSFSLSRAGIRRQRAQTVFDHVSAARDRLLLRMAQNEVFVENQSSGDSQIA